MEGTGPKSFYLIEFNAKNCFTLVIDSFSLTFSHLSLSIRTWFHCARLSLFKPLMPFLLDFPFLRGVIRTDSEATELQVELEIDEIDIYSRLSEE